MDAMTRLRHRRFQQALRRAVWRRPLLTWPEGEREAFLLRYRWASSVDDLRPDDRDALVSALTGMEEPS